jgi:uncharacterized protein
MSVAKRTYVRGFVDSLLGWLVGLPSECNTYATSEIKIPLDDEIQLAASLYQPVLPEDSRPKGLILLYGPYGRGALGNIMQTGMFAARGYLVLHVSCRGTFGSTGSFDPGRSEAADSQKIVAWVRRQTWYPGSLATLGTSYLGYTQWALLRNPPAELAAAVINVAPHDYSRNYWLNGALKLDLLRWSDMIAHQEDAGWAPAGMRLFSNAKVMTRVCEGLPLKSSAEAYFGGSAEWIHYPMTHPDTRDQYYAVTQHSEALERANIPVLLISGWYDIFLEQTMEQYTRLSQRGCKVGLTVGPWDHMHAVGARTTRENFAWLEEHVANDSESKRQHAVSVFVTGADEWRNMTKWPPATDGHELFLQPSSRLGFSKPASESLPSTFTFDPAHPTPSIGGPGHVNGGRKKDNALSTRTDALTFTTDPLVSDIEILGKVIVELIHSSDTPYVDLLVRLSEVDKKGDSYNLTETYMRLKPDRPTGNLRIELPDCAHRFKCGFKIRLIVAGGSFPMFSRNLGTGEIPELGSTYRSAQHTIYHGASGFSRLVLPTNASASPRTFNSTNRTSSSCAGL